MQLKKEFLELSTNFNNNINEDKIRICRGEKNVMATYST